MIVVQCPWAHKLHAALVLTYQQWEKRMIRKTRGGFKVVSSKGKNLGGPYKSRAAAARRLRQVEFFKHRKH